MKLRLSDLLDNKEIVVSSSLSGNEWENLVVDHIMFDTRKQNVGKETLFVQLSKTTSYIDQARAKGVRLFLSNKKPESILENEVFFICENVLDLLQKMARKYRATHPAQFVVITGSNGKTTTKEWLFTLVQNELRTGKSPASYNSQLGVPLSILSIEKSDELAIIEAGISQKGEMEKLHSMIQADIGILTTMGDAHADGFESFEQKLEEKLKAFETCEKLIFEETDSCSKSQIAQLLSCELISWSKKYKSADYQVSTSKHNSHTRIMLSRKNSAEFNFPLHDNASISNITNAIILALELNIPPASIQKHLDNIQAVSLRLELIKASNNCLLINDSYNADLTSLQNALDFAITQKNKRNLTLVLSDFDQQKNNEFFNSQLHQLIQSYPIDSLYFIGENNAKLSPDIQFKETKDLLNFLIKNKPSDELILLKGARRFQLENISSYLEENLHRTVLHTDLQSIHTNVKFFRSIIPTHTKIMGVIKAGAYGSDSVSIGKYLENIAVDYLAVAYIDEGIELRNEGISMPIMVMNPDPSLMSLAAEYQLEPEIYALHQLENLQLEKELSIHVKLDSGMNRLGFKENEIEELKGFLGENSWIKVKSAFSHLSSADDSEMKGFSEEQNECYKKLYDKLCTGLDYKPLSHLCNTNGAISFPEYHYDMIRIGIGLHGLVNHEGLISSHKLTSYVAQIKEISKGDTVGYNRSFVAPREMKVATISIGYADGLSRKHGNGKAQFYIKGQAFPTVGNISMDTCSIDISHSAVNVGDEVVIFENKEQLFELCDTAEQIPYEFICGIGKRVARKSSLIY